MDKVSVIIPTYKGMNSLSRTIDSVINQTYNNIEIIVVDDNGKYTVESQKTYDIVKNYKNVIYIQHVNNMNGAVARNSGIQKASGKYICFLDDDDLILPTRIEKCVNALKNTIYDGVFCDVLCTNENLIPQRIVTVRKVGNCSKEILLNEMFFGTGSNLFLSATSCRMINGFNPKYERNQDLEFMLRFYRNYKTTNINEILIIKSKNDVNNIPNYLKYLSVKQQFNKDFNYEIQSLTKDEQDSYYKNIEKKLNLINVRNLKFKDIFHNFSLREIPMCIIFKYKINETKFFTYINTFRKRIIAIKIKKHIPTKLYDYIRKVN